MEPASLPRLSHYFLSVLFIEGTLDCNIFSFLQRALAAERRLAAQLGAPSPPVPDSAVVNAGYGGQGMSCYRSLLNIVVFRRVAKGT